MIKNSLQFAGRSLFVLPIGLSLALATGAYFKNFWPAPTTADKRGLVQSDTPPEKIAEAIAALSPASQEELRLRDVQILAANPLDATAITNLTILEGLQGKQDKVNQLTELAASRSLRNPQLQFAALQSALSEGKAEKAFTHFDGILSSTPRLASAVYEAILPALNDDKHQAALVGVLKREPAWRTSFFNWLTKTDSTNTVLPALFNQMGKSGVAIFDSERRNFIESLLRAKKFELGYFTWLDSLQPEDLAKTGLIYDGNFDREPKNQFFDWNLLKLKNAVLVVRPRPDDPKNRALVLSFLASSKYFQHAYQYLRLSPGKYNFSGFESAKALKTPKGLRWVVSCIEAPKQIGMSPIFSEASPWIEFGFEFEVPVDNCQTQLLRLQTASTAVLDAEISGEIFFDDFKITTITDVIATQDQPSQNSATETVTDDAQSGEVAPKTN